ncbi:hypothetical protein BC940DRAFT_48564 [Gongronella butleri]|nr:hypothetical protein BC940DRAFT_48564 [Gongronella butleri]
MIPAFCLFVLFIFSRPTRRDHSPQLTGHLARRFSSTGTNWAPLGLWVHFFADFQGKKPRLRGFIWFALKEVLNCRAVGFCYQLAAQMHVQNKF